MKPFSLLIALCFLLMHQYLKAQQSVNLNECFDKALANSALLGVGGENTKIEALKIQNLNAKFYPTIDLNAQATYQSDVPFSNVSFPMPDMELPTPTQDQYKLSLDISQLIYDGGVVKYQKDIEKISTAIENKNVDIKHHSLKQQVCNTYFGVAILQATLIQIDELITTLNAQLKVVESAIENGVMMSIERDKIEAGIAKSEQQKSDLQNNMKATVDILNTLTGMNTTTETIFETSFARSAGLNPRPELSMMKLQQQKLMATSSLTESARKPKVAAFAQIGYGRPGINIIDDEFSEYYIVGIKASWNVFDWNKAKREREILSISSGIVEKQKNDIEQKFDIAAMKKRADIEALQQTIEKDREIVALRKSIVETMESQLKHGVITTTEYLIEKNEQTKANIQLEIHELKLKQAEAELELIIGSF